MFKCARQQQKEVGNWSQCLLRPWRQPSSHRQLCRASKSSSPSPLACRSNDCFSTPKHLSFVRSSNINTHVAFHPPARFTHAIFNILAGLFLLGDLKREKDNRKRLNNTIKNYFDDINERCSENSSNHV